MDIARIDCNAWHATYLQQGQSRPPRRRCVTYRRLANELSTLPLDAPYVDILKCLEAHKADDPEFWEGLMVQMRQLPPETDWYTAMLALCDWLRQENYLFVTALFTDWLLEGK